MGGLITYRLTLENKNICQGAIYFAPALKAIVGKFISFIGILIGRIFGTIKTFKPRRELGSKSEYSVKMTREDPLTYNEGARMISIKALLESMNQCEITFKDYKADYLMFMGAKDTIINNECSITLYLQCKSEDKTLYFYENLWHDVLHEEEMFDIVPKVIEWIKHRIPIYECFEINIKGNS